MKWTTRIYGRDVELKSSLPQIREAATIVENAIWYFIKEPDPVCLRPNWHSGKGRREVHQADVWAETHASYHWRLVKGFNLLLRAER